MLLLIKAKKQKGEISNVSSDGNRVQQLFAEDNGSSNLIKLKYKHIFCN